MPGEVVSGDADRPLRTLSDKLNWLIDHAHPAGRGRLSDNEVSFLIHKATGVQISYATIWKLRNGQNSNPKLNVIEALAKTFGVPPAFFFDDYDETQLGLLKEQVELLALVRDAGITAVELRTLLGLGREEREVVAGLIKRTVRAGSAETGGDHGESTDARAPA